ncbi:hypothetical protein HMPREF1144_3719 [Klebsiella sp. OBRC7]|nr:hypothetical protein HMPREF1144_3719 [Klebsiella sp. OBRC7]
MIPLAEKRANARIASGVPGDAFSAKKALWLRVSSTFMAVARDSHISVIIATLA